MSTSQPQQAPDERRKHPRQAANLAVEIYAYAKNGDLQYESTSLRDFSDSGISFMTQHLQHYHIGQDIKFQLLDDFTLADKNTLNGKGFVAWIQTAQHEEKAWVGICMYHCLTIS